MGAENLIIASKPPELVVNIENSVKGAKVVFNNGFNLYTSGVNEIKIEGDIITIYRATLNARFSVDYNLPTLDKFGTSTPEELVEYWQTNNFFFDLTPSSGFNITYRAQNWTQLTTVIATDPNEGELAYVIESQGTKFDVTGLINPYKSAGLWYYNGSAWTNSQQEIAEALGIAIEDIVAIESVNAAQDIAISNNAAGVLANSGNIVALQNDKADKSIQITGADSVEGGGDLSASRQFRLVNDEASPAANKVYSINPAAVKGYNFITDLVSNNAGQIKLNWTPANRPISAAGVTAGVQLAIPLNNNYTVSADPTTKYPYLADSGIGGQNVIDPATLFLRELKEGQSIVFRVKAGYLNKGAGQNGNAQIIISNPNPASTFESLKSIPTPDGVTTKSEEIEFYLIADTLSINPLYGYQFEGVTTFNDGNFQFFIDEITAFYLPTELFNKTP